MIRKATKNLFSLVFLLVVLLYPAVGYAEATLQAELLVEYFDSGSPGARAGVMVGDNLLAYNGVALISPATLLVFEENPPASSTAALRVRREGQVITLTVPTGPLGIVASMELPNRVRDLYRESWIALQAENIQQSLVKTRAAARAMTVRGERVTAGWIWWSQALRFERAQRWAEACQSYTEALALLATSPDIAARSRAWSSLGRCEFNQNRVSEATQAWAKALTIDAESGFRWWAAGDLAQLGAAAKAQGDLLKAKEHYLNARSAYLQISTPSSGFAVVLNNLGEVILALGDLRSAEDLLNSSLRMKESLAGRDPDPPALLSIAGTLSNLGGIALARGDLKFAREYFTRALKTREQYLLEDSTDLAAGFSNLGYVEHEEGRITEAETYYRRALGIYQQVAKETALHAAVLGNLGNAAYDRKDFTAAETFYNQAITILERVSPDSLDTAKAYLNYGNILAAMNKLDLARARHLRAKTIYERLAPGSLDLALVLNSMGTLALSEKRFAEAQQFFSQAVSIIENQRSQVRVTEARAFLVAGRMSEYTGLIRSYIGLKDYAHAFDTLEQLRARSLIELIVERDLDLGADAPAALVNRLRGTIEKKNAAYYRISVLDPQRDAPTIQQLRNGIQSLAVEERQVISEIRQNSPKFASLKYPEPLDLVKTRDILDNGTLLLTYFVDESETYVFAATKTTLNFYPLSISRKDLNSKVSTFMMRVALPGGAGVVGAPGRELYDLLIKPVRGEIEAAQRVLICPDGPLHKLSFAALETTDSTERKYVIELKPLHFIVSMSIYEELRKRERNYGVPEQRIFLALGNPSYKSTGGSFQQVVRECGTVRDQLKPLPVTQEQVEAIRELFAEKTLVRLAEQASIKTLQRESPKATVIHIASHGFVENCDPLRSFLALTPEQSPGGGEGLLHASEIMESLRLNADLVVLSACQTGLGEVTRNEGIIGLTRAFQYAGARSVVMSLWEITDNSSSVLMKEFYTQYKNGRSKDVALQLAQQKLIKSEFSHPYYWAAFEMVGDWQ